MNRKLLNGLLVLAVASSGVVTFTSCKDEDFRTNSVLTESSLQAQIDALRNVTDAEFYSKLKDVVEGWIAEELPNLPNGCTCTNQEDWEKIANELTAKYSNPYNWTYQDFVNAAAGMKTVLDNIKAGNYDAVSDYVDSLYKMMYENIFPEEDWFNQIFNSLDNLLERATSVEVSQVWNQVFGTVNLPLDVKSTILATYLFEGPTFDFPSGAYAYLNDASPSKDQEVMDVISNLNPVNAGMLVNHSFTDGGELGNMGATVLTINPSSNNYLDPSKYTIELVNSKGEVAFSNNDDSKGTLELQDYDDMLYFGVSRSGAPGVYQLNVNANSDDYSGLKVDLDKSALKSAVQNLIDTKSISSVAKLGKVVFESVNNKLPAYAVKVSWEEDVYDNNTHKVTETITNSVYSGFDLAAAVIHPLSYGTNLGKVIPNKQLPIIHNTLAEYLERVQNKLHFDISIPELTDDMKVDFNVLIKDGYVYFQVYNEDGVLVDTDPIKIQYSGTGINASDADLTALVEAILQAQSMELESGLKYKLVKEINDSLADLNQQILDLENKVNDWLSKLQNSSKLDYAQKLLDFYNDLATRANNFLANPNHYLQVAMAYSFGDGYHFMSNDVYMPLTVSTKNGTNLDLITTSYTGDILVPSYKKYVAITGVKSNTDRSFNYSTEGLAAYNTGDLNTVFEGKKEKISVDLSQLAGKTVRLTYVSVDYRGKCSMENYYLTVVQ